MLFRGPFEKLVEAALADAQTLIARNKRVCICFTVYAAGRGVYCVGVSTVTDASQRKPAAIPPTMARARESAVLAWGFIA